MITLRTSLQRRHDSRREQLWQTFDSEDRADALADGFATLAMLNEDHLAPRTRTARHPECDAEIITYVRAGAVAFEDSAGRSGKIGAGEFHRTETVGGVAQGPWNASYKERAHVFHLWFRLKPRELRSGDEQRRFSAEDRRRGLCTIASQDGGHGSLRLHQDASIMSALLEPGQTVTHQLAPGRRAWLHIVDGAGSLGPHAMSIGDGAGITDEKALSFTARDQAEVLLIELGDA